MFGWLGENNKMLTDKYTWEEICDRLINKLNPEAPRVFKKWFMERECVGYLFDYLLISRAYNIWREIQAHGDHFVVISGREGAGKSTLALQLATMVNPNFRIDNICYNLKQYMDILRNRARIYTRDLEKESVVIDEGGIELFSREAMAASNRTIAKTAFVQRQLNLFVIICIPNFYMLDTVIREHRVKTLLHVLKRGSYKAIVGTGIKKIVKDGKATKEVTSVKLPTDKFWYGNFTKQFPKEINQDDYESYKLDNIKNFLDEMGDEGPTEQAVLPMTQVTKVLGINRNTVKSLINQGLLKGRKLSNNLNSRWVIDKESFENYLKNKDLVYKAPNT